MTLDFQVVIDFDFDVDYFMDWCKDNMDHLNWLCNDREISEWTDDDIDYALSYYHDRFELDRILYDNYISDEQKSEMIEAVKKQIN